MSAEDANDEAGQSETAPTAPALGTLDHWLAAPMWVISLLFLILFAGLLQELRTETVWPFSFSIYLVGAMLLWPVFMLEWIIHILAGSRHRWHHALYCVAPPLRLGGREHAQWQCIWLPVIGWQTVDRALVRRLEKAFSGPMVVVAIMVLPLLGVDWFWQEAVARRAWLRHTLDTAMSVIWLAFTIELVIMTAIVRKWVAYCIEHWIDVVIVLLPVVGFLRILQLLRLGGVSHVGRMLRVYRLRGMTVRASRAFLLLDVVRRFLQINPEKRLAVLKERLEEQYDAIEETRREMTELEARLAADRAAEEPSKPSG